MAYFSSFDSVYGVFMCPGSYDQTEEKLTFYLLNRVMWDADMTEEEYADLIKGYLYVMCGDGYEYIYDYLMSRIEVARNECWTSMAWTDPSERIDLGRVADEFEYYIELFRHAEELACTEAQEKNISLMSRTMYFTGLVAVHTDWYLNGTAEQKEKYTEIYSCFKQLALETGFCLTTPDEPITEEMFDIDRNIAEYFSFNQAPGGSETWWKYN